MDRMDLIADRLVDIRAVQREHDELLRKILEVLTGAKLEPAYKTYHWREGNSVPPAVRGTYEPDGAGGLRLVTSEEIGR